MVTRLVASLPSTFLGFIGITDVQFIHAEGLALGDAFGLGG